MIIEITSCEFDYPTLGVRYKKRGTVSIHTAPLPICSCFLLFPVLYIPIY